MNIAIRIFLKEILELRRDKRTFYSAILGPIFLVYLLLASMSFVEKSFRQPKSQKLHVVSSDIGKAFVSQLKGIKEIDMISLKSEAEGKEMVASGSAKVVLSFSQQGQTLVMKALYDEDEVKAQVLIRILEEAIAKSNSLRVNQLLDSAGVPATDREPLKLQRQPLPKKQESAGSSVAGFLPYLIVIWAFYGGFGLASESVAAEKEKNTLETLLIAPISRLQVALGKFLTLLAVSLMGSMVSVGTMLFLGPRIGSKMLFPDGFGLSVGMIAAIIGVVVPLCAMFAGLLLAVSAFSKNTRECQTYLTLVSFIVLIPAVFSQFIGFTDFARAQWVAFVPVLNSATVLRQALLGNVDTSMALITVSLSIVLAAATLAWAIKMFKRESILSKS